MKRYILIRRVESEIAKVNEEIDMRIVRGLSYKSLAKKHKALIAELRSLKRTPGIMNSFAQYASTFLL
jgi:hypothetical protein